MSVQNMTILAVAKEIVLATDYVKCFEDSWNAYISKKYTNICLYQKTPRCIVSILYYIAEQLDRGKLAFLHSKDI